MKLRELKEKDALGMLEWMHSSSSHVFIKDFYHYTEDDVLQFIRHSQSDKENIHYACVDDQDCYLGTVSLKNIDLQNHHAEFAISFIPKAHGTGASTFATLEILKKAFVELGLNKVYLNVLTVNHRAIAFYEKIGFQKVGCFRQHIVKDNHVYDLLWYDILKEEFIH